MLFRSGELKIDLTGIINGDGEYEVTIAPLTEGVDVELGAIQIFKRDDKEAEADLNTKLTNQPLTKNLSISGWQAGTPYSAKLTLKAGSANTGNFAVFIKKLN